MFTLEHKFWVIFRADTDIGIVKKFLYPILANKHTMILKTMLANICNKNVTEAEYFRDKQINNRILQN